MRRYLGGGLVIVMMFGSASASMAQRESADDTDDPRAAIEGLRLEDLTDRIGRLTTEMRALRDEVSTLRGKAEAWVGVWEPFGEDLRSVLEDQVKYEYALMRNGGFRTLTASSWNSGWRVMTSPYMTGDSGTFRLGGSMWIWDTRDPRDDSGFLHLYYHYTNEGVVARDGNGVRGSGSNSGEGTIYRRRR